MDFISYFLFAADDPKINEVTKKDFTSKESFYFFDTENRNNMIGLMVTGTAMIEIKTPYGEWTINNILKTGSLFGVEEISTNIKTRRIIEYKATGLEHGSYLEIDREYLLLNMAQEPIQRYIIDRLIDILLDINCLHQYTKTSMRIKFIKELADIAIDLNLEIKDFTITFPTFINITFLAKYLNASRASILSELKNLQKVGVLVSKKPIMIDLRKSTFI
ncbi:Crp/Fnr family transcriptional regulator [Listeria sp. PSOL-1]|uniref:Crp/Fnr family transcriptional regulator n=1 Tax=Listeria sp. PSOL-1 TaxID=1844999 RepID=UPI0013CF6F4B|nr:Crp/Fnr family transcriptional regulator [Listeria sp. PSOL-1]